MAAELPIHPEDYSEHIRELRLNVAELNARMTAIEQSVDRIEEVSRDVKDLVKLFQTSRGVLAAVKWTAGIAAALATVWAALHWSR